MQKFKKILVAADVRFDDHPIIAEAADVAEHTGAELKIVDTMRELPWTVRLSLDDHEHVRDLMVAEKAAKLEAIAEKLRQRGLKVESKVLRGRTSVEIIREVMRSDHDLVLRVAKGKDSRSPGFFGVTGMQLLRQCPCAVWLVAPDAKIEFQHVMGCIDTSSEDERDAKLNHEVLELATAICKYHESRLSVVHSWSIWADQILKHRMTDEEHDKMEANRERQAKSLFGKFLETHGLNLESPEAHLVLGEAVTSIPEYARQNGVDLVVMGTVARSGLSGMIMGNTAEQVLRAISCSVLALKPPGFVSPVQMDS